MNVRNVLEGGSTIVVAAVALTMAYTYFHDRHAAAASPTFETSALVPDWKASNATGIRTGPGDASVVITEFMDFECPYCAALVPMVDSIMGEYPGEVALVFHHFPLSMHQSAVEAAIAAECADRQGRFWEMYRELLEGQSWFGTQPWQDYAKAAGVANVADFARCVTLPQDSFPRIADGRSLGARTGVMGTPTTWVNGRVIHPALVDIGDLVSRH